MALQSTVYHIRSPKLRPFVQYILFNQADQVQQKQVVTSLPNANICLGILKERVLRQKEQQLFLQGHSGISAYLSALYARPHHFVLEQDFDEICIDFTPAGYTHFFRSPLKTYVLEEALLSENFGAEAVFFFEWVFGQSNLQDRGRTIEAWLLQRLSIRTNDRAEVFLRQLQQLSGICSVEQLRNQLCCSERKLQRTFAQLLDCSPKNYLRIRRFRQLLQHLNRVEAAIHWEQVAYQFGYYDYSHLVKEFKAFTGQAPKAFWQHRLEIEATVTVCIQPSSA
ncbi:MAG: AraC family transcriptional regulator [Phaeodactylibacter sp.]|nr:AraC family transcriptional regulator [Phaeodactylibacter sp.]